MRLTAHIVRKDLLRQRWVICLWLVLLGVQAAVAVHALAQPAQRNRMLTDEEPTIALAIATAGILGLIVLGAIQEDTALGSRSFWMARPISAGRLLRAKLAFVAFLVVVQAAIRVGVFAWAGLEARDLFLAGAEELLEGGAFALVVAAFAVISPNALSFAIRTTAIVASAMVGALVTGAIDYGYSSMGDPSGRMASMLIVVFFASGLLGLGVVATQLLARHHGRILPLGVFTATLAIISTWLVWPWNFFDGPATETAAANPGSGPVATIAFPLEGNRLMVRTTPRARGRPGGTWLGAHLPNVRLPDGSIVIPSSPESGELRWGDRLLPIRGPDGAIGYPGRYLGTPGDILSLSDVAALAAAPLKLLGPAEPTRFVNLLPIAPADFARLQREPARVRATIVGVRVAPAASEPLVVGRGFVRQPDGMQVAVTARWSGTAMWPDRSGPTSVDGDRFEVQAQGYRSLFHGNPASRTIGLFEFPVYHQQHNAEYLAVNRSAGEAAIAGLEGSGHARIGGLQRYVLRLVVPIEQPLPRPSPLINLTRVPNAAWLEQAELVRVTLRSSSVVRGELAADSVLAAPAP